MTRDAIQVLGGVGYCSEFPVEQYARDLKILSIWEGTHYINSLDLVGRKLALEGGQVFQNWFQEASKFIEEHRKDDDFALDFDILDRAVKITGEYPMSFLDYFHGGKISLVALHATRFMECFSEGFMGQLMLEQALIARDKLKGIDTDSADGIFYRGKMETVKYFCRNILTNVFARHIAFKEEDTSAVDIPEEAF